MVNQQGVILDWNDLNMRLQCWGTEYQGKTLFPLNIYKILIETRLFCLDNTLLHHVNHNLHNNNYKICIFQLAWLHFVNVIIRILHHFFFFFCSNKYMISRANAEANSSCIHMMGAYRTNNNLIDCWIDYVLAWANSSK